ncbi:hypothetical protein AB4P95_30110 (plasmid) [Pseudomonas sp. A1437]|uniref:hypothetical protein n=1 Tax=Pseudomonas sp. A1437 TaxID=3235107 RepID=UPI003784620D
MTRAEARALFDAAKLDYRVITPENMQLLRTRINRAMVASGLIKSTYRCRQRAIVREGYGEIRCKSFYFDSREAITFNPDGFIGFAGWADDKNVQPVLAGFADWIRELKP